MVSSRTAEFGRASIRNREYSAMPPNEAYPRALAAAKEAVKLDDSSAEAHNSLAFVTFYWDWDAATAEREYKRAIALSPTPRPQSVAYSNV